MEESAANGEPEVNISDYAQTLLKSTENLKKTLELLTDEMKINIPKASPSEVKFKKETIKKASSLMRVSSRLMEMLKRKKQKTLGGNSNGTPSSVSITNGKKKSLKGSLYNLRKTRSEESLNESVIKSDVFREMTPKAIRKSDLKLARKTISRLNASEKRSICCVSITSEGTVKLIPSDGEHVTFLNGALTVICSGEAIKWIKPDGNVLDPKDKHERVHVEARNGQLFLSLFNINAMDIGTWTCLSAIDNTSVAFNLKKFYPTAFDKVPGTQTSNVGNDVKIQCKVIGVPTVKVTWDFNGKPLGE
ncbi:unnamed protein product [Diamesa serratosioi]